MVVKPEQMLKPEGRQPDTRRDGTRSIELRRYDSSIEEESQMSLGQLAREVELEQSPEVTTYGDGSESRNCKLDLNQEYWEKRAREADTHTICITVLNVSFSSSRVMKSSGEVYYINLFHLAFAVPIVLLIILANRRAGRTALSFFAYLLMSFRNVISIYHMNVLFADDQKNQRVGFFITSIGLTILNTNMMLHFFKFFKSKVFFNLFLIALMRGLCYYS